MYRMAKLGYERKGRGEGKGTKEGKIREIEMFFPLFLFLQK